MTAPGDGASAPRPPPPPLRPLAWREIGWIYLVLQGSGALLLGVALGVLLALRPLLGGGDAPFLRSWLATFVLLPVTFCPALALWHRWALRRFGKRGGWFRAIAEVAFAVEVIACVLFHRIA